MEKRAKRKAVYEESHVGRWFVTAAIIIGLFSFSGWWLFAGQSQSRVRQACLDKISIMVDRIDELSTAWNQRSMPDYMSPDSSDNNSSSSKNNADPGSKPHEATKSPAPDSATPAKTTQPLPQTAPPAEPEVSPEDQEKLRNLIQNLEKKP